MHILIRLSGDVSTKARSTRKRFTQTLVDNLRDGLSSHQYEARIDKGWNRITVETEEPGALEVCARIFGVQSVSEVERYRWTGLDDLVTKATETFREEVRDRSFAVRTRRGGHKVDSIPFTSGDVEVALGTELLNYARRVDLTNPEVTTSIEVRSRHADLFTSRISAPGGLPLGVEGRALALVSGGFDSAVAAWLMLKRGLGLDYLFFNLGGLAHEVGVLRVMKVVADRWSYGDRPRLWAVDLRPAVADLQDKITPRYWQVVLKRQMMRAAAQVAQRHRLPALVTGEAIGQVSSQTLTNLAVIAASTSMPILQPLLGFNKEEIVKIAREIGTFDLSAAVGEYCAILPRNPATAARLDVIEKEEQALDLDLLEQAVRTGRTIDLRALAVDEIGASQLEIDSVPEGATIVDLRTKAAFQTWHYPDAMFMEYNQALRAYSSFRRDTVYVLYCEVGLKSAHLAELMQSEGFQAHHIRGGLKQLRDLVTADS